MSISPGGCGAPSRPPACRSSCRGLATPPWACSPGLTTRGAARFGSTHTPTSTRPRRPQAASSPACRWPSSPVIATATTGRRSVTARPLPRSRSSCSASEMSRQKESGSAWNARPSRLWNGGGVARGAMCWGRSMRSLSGSTRFTCMWTSTASGPTLLRESSMSLPRGVCRWRMRRPSSGRARTLSNPRRHIGNVHAGARRRGEDLARRATNPRFARRLRRRRSHGVGSG